MTKTFPRHEIERKVKQEEILGKEEGKREEMLATCRPKLGKMQENVLFLSLFDFLWLGSIIERVGDLFQTLFLLPQPPFIVSPEPKQPAYAAFTP